MKPMYMYRPFLYPPSSEESFLVHIKFLFSLVHVQLLPFSKQLGEKERALLPLSYNRQCGIILSAYSLA